MSLYFASTKSCNGAIESGIGVNFPKGLIVACGGMSFSKDGVASLVHKEQYFSAHLVGLVDTLFSIIGYPFAVAAYLVLMVLGVASQLLLWPFAIFVWTRPNAQSPKRLAFKAYMIAIGVSALLGIPSIIGATALVVLSPLQILIPELTVYVFQLHKWGKAE